MLTLVATDGKVARAHAPLVLHPTSRNDRSPRGMRPDSVDDPTHAYLYGATSLDFARLGAPIEMEPGDTLSPRPTSLDPVRPGVLVTESRAETRLTISSLGNLRDDHNWLDGAGIGLRVQRISGDTVAGVWDGWGIVPSRSGFFCAVRTNAEP